MQSRWRRWRFLLLTASLLALAVPATASANIKFVAKVASTSGPVPGYSYVMPVQQNTVANDTLVLMAADPGRNINAVADTEGNTWVKDVANGSVSIWHAVEVTPLMLSKNDHITVSVSMYSSFNDAQVIELNGVDTANPVDTTIKQSYGDPSPATATENVTAQGNDDAFVDVASFLTKDRSAPAGITQLDSLYQFDPGIKADLGPAGAYSESWSAGDAVSSTVRASVLYRAYVPAAPMCSGSTPNIHEYQDGCPLYNAGSWVNAPLPDSAPVDPNSSSYMAAQMRTMDLNPDGSLMTGAPQGLRWNEGVDVYVQNRTDRSTWKTVCSTEVLNGNSWAWMNDIHNAWVTFKAPIPDGSFPSTDGGSDHGVTLYNAATGEMWDFYEWRGAAPAGTTDPQGRTCDYEADGGDYQNNLANNPGYFINQPLGSGVQEDNMWGRRAAALPSIAGVITPDEWNNPLPDFGHTLQIIVGCANTTKQYWPATRHDGCSGTGGSGGLPEGARFRIDPNYACPHPTAGSSGPTQLAYDRAYSLCRTLQKYGGVVTDQTGSGTAYTLAGVMNGKPDSIASDGGNCCSSNTPVGSGTQWPNWYWDVGVDRALPTAQVIDQSYRPPYAPAQ